MKVALYSENQNQDFSTEMEDFLIGRDMWLGLTDYVPDDVVFIVLPDMLNASYAAGIKPIDQHIPNEGIRAAIDAVRTKTDKYVVFVCTNIFYSSGVRPGTLGATSMISSFIEHEMCHRCQMERGDLVLLEREQWVAVWKGEEFILNNLTTEEYHNLPWEIEAEIKYGVMLSRLSLGKLSCDEARLMLLIEREEDIPEVKGTGVIDWKALDAALTASIRIRTCKMGEKEKVKIKEFFINFSRKEIGLKPEEYLYKYLSAMSDKDLIPPNLWRHVSEFLNSGKEEAKKLYMDFEGTTYKEILESRSNL